MTSKYRKDGKLKRTINNSSRRKVEQRLRELGSRGLTDVHATILTPEQLAREWTPERVERLFATVKPNPRVRGQNWGAGPGDYY